MIAGTHGRPRPAWSLRLSLMLWLLVPLSGILCISLWLTYRSAVEQARTITEQLLIASARVIAEQIHYVDNRIEAVIPPSALELFVTESRDRAVYRINGSDDRLVGGYDDLALPPTEVGNLAYVYYDTNFRGAETHAVAYKQPVVTPEGTVSATVIVAETLKGQAAFVRNIWISHFLQQAVLLLAVTAFYWIGIERGLKPLIGLRRAIHERPPGDFSPLPTTDLQAEIRPVADALNSFMSRYEQQFASRRRFLDNAAHQLRTPLTVLKAQINYALKTDSAAEKTEALEAADSSVSDMGRLATQLLVLARAEGGRSGLDLVPVDFRSIALDALEQAAPRAAKAGVTLVLEADSPCRAFADPLLAREMIGNLIDNAIIYCGPGATAVTSVAERDGSVCVGVADTGPGMSPRHREHGFERFHRGAGATTPGSGLGLAIVSEIATAFGGSATLQQNAQGGLTVAITLPASWSEA